MTVEQQSIDITDIPELARLAEEVSASRRPRVLRRGNHDIALLVPLGDGVIAPMPPNPALDALLAGLPEDDPVVRTAGALHTDQPFLGYDEEKAAFEIAVALDALATWER